MALVAGAGGPQQHGKATFTVAVNGREAAQGQVTEENADVLQQFDLTGHVRTGASEVAVEVKGRNEPDVPGRRPALRAVQGRAARQAGAGGGEGLRPHPPAHEGRAAGEGNGEVRRQGAGAGRERLGSMGRAMRQPVESTGSISPKLAATREKADSITQVVTTTTQVAGRADLLSTNAAIEAGKAGEHGRGFLVVAREARRLAGQAAVATLDIESRVRLTRGAVSAGVMQKGKFGEGVRSGAGRVAEVNGQTGQIITEVTGLSERFRSVNEGMNSQAVGAHQINEAMGGIASNVRETSAALEELNKATHHLRASVEQLNREVASFKV